MSGKHKNSEHDNHHDVSHGHDAQPAVDDHAAAADSHDAHGHDSHDKHDSHDDDHGHGHDAHPKTPGEPFKLRFRKITIPVARESWLFIVPLLVVAGIFQSFGQTAGVVTMVLCIGYVIFFFRDIERIIPDDPSLILSPADGKIISISKVREKEFLQEECYRVSIFMSLFDNHINRLPVEGEIVYQKHKTGEWLVASSAEAVTRNEQNAIGVKGEQGNIYLIQVAGLVARRIVSHINIGDKLKRGQRFGLIMFGSRVDLYLPTSKVILEVKKGERVYGGTSIVGIYND